MPEGGAAFARPRKALGPSPHLYAANCGPATGDSFSRIAQIFSLHGPVQGVTAADGSLARVIVSFFSADCAAAAREAWHGRPCPALQGRLMNLQFAELVAGKKVGDSLPVWRTVSEVGIPGLFLLAGFVTEQEEAALVAAVDARPWQGLAKRRVQHYGYEFIYKIRNVDLDQRLGEMPEFVHAILERIACVKELEQVGEVCLPLDQLTVNEYPRGVGLSPHVDTHSAFEGAILSLSLVGGCIMEFRRYGRQDFRAGVERRALLLPPRSLLILTGEARYGWHHYIPHHKVDIVDGETIDRGPRRVSLTFRRVRSGPCQCDFPQDCDSRLADFEEASAHCTATDAIHMQGQG